MLFAIMLFSLYLKLLYICIDSFARACEERGYYSVKVRDLLLVMFIATYSIMFMMHINY